MTDVVVALAAALGVYPVLRRWAVWRWLAALAAVLGLLGALTLADTGVASALLAVPCGAALALACWSSPVPTAHLYAAAGLAIAAVVAWGLALDDWPPPRHDVSAPALGAVLVAVALGLLAAAGAGRAGASRMRAVCLLTAAASGVAFAVQEDSLLTWAWAPATAALGLTALLRGRRGASAAAPQTDEVDEAVLAAFAREHGERLGPVVVVIAAYNEADGLPGVLPALPTEACGLHVDVLVVDDGSLDGTAEAASGRSPRSAAATSPPVRSTAVRGRRCDWATGSRASAGRRTSSRRTPTGSTPPTRSPTVLAPVVEGRADFVTGSRRLGVLENRDAVRQAGTYLFAWLASALLGRYVTDTSFGLRAMRVEVTAAVTLNQPQYQASELLVGVVSHGFRVLEVPGTMRVRSAGATKKGGNLAYGSRYARVLLGTWWREGCPTPVAGTAPALGGSTRHVPAMSLPGPLQ